MKTKFKSVELCPNCGTEQNVNEITQPCPNCGEILVACSLCAITIDGNCDGCINGSKFLLKNKNIS